MCAARSGELPPGVGQGERREVRLRSRVPSRASIRPTALETVALESSSSAAAPVKERSSDDLGENRQAFEVGSLAIWFNLETMSFDSFYF